MEISRRSLIGAAGLLSTAFAASAAEACTVIGSIRPIAFSDAACRRSLRELVSLINEAPALADAELAERADGLSIQFDESVTDELVAFPGMLPIENRDLIRSWSLSAGQRDRSPIALREVNLLKDRKGIALYQFTLRRDLYHPGLTGEDVDGGSCDVPHDPFYAAQDVSYLGLFFNNRLREVSAFEQWLREL